MIRDFDVVGAVDAVAVVAFGFAADGSFAVVAVAEIVNNPIDLLTHHLRLMGKLLRKLL